MSVVRKLVDLDFLAGELRKHGKVLSKCEECGRLFTDVQKAKLHRKIHSSVTILLPRTPEANHKQEVNVEKDSVTTTTAAPQESISNGGESSDDGHLDYGFILEAIANANETMTFGDLEKLSTQITKKQKQQNSDVDFGRRGKGPSSEKLSCTRYPSEDCGSPRSNVNNRKQVSGRLSSERSDHPHGSNTCMNTDTSPNRSGSYLQQNYNLATTSHKSSTTRFSGNHIGLNKEVSPTNSFFRDGVGLNNELRPSTRSQRASTKRFSGNCVGFNNELSPSIINRRSINTPCSEGQDEVMSPVVVASQNPLQATAQKQKNQELFGTDSQQCGLLGGQDPVEQSSDPHPTFTQDPLQDHLVQQMMGGSSFLQLLNEPLDETFDVLYNTQDCGSRHVNQDLENNALENNSYNVDQNPGFNTHSSSFDQTDVNTGSRGSRHNRFNTSTIFGEKVNTGSSIYRNEDINVRSSYEQHDGEFLPPLTRFDTSNSRNGLAISSCYVQHRSKNMPELTKFKSSNWSNSPDIRSSGVQHAHENMPALTRFGTISDWRNSLPLRSTSSTRSEVSQSNMAYEASGDISRLDGTGSAEPEASASASKLKPEDVSLDDIAEETVAKSAAPSKLKPEAVNLNDIAEEYVAKSASPSKLKSDLMHLKNTTVQAHTKNYASSKIITLAANLNEIEETDTKGDAPSKVKIKAAVGKLSKNKSVISLSLLPCKHCSVKFETFVELINHMSDFHHVVISKCTKCGQIFYEAEAVKKHLLVHRPIIPVGPHASVGKYGKAARQTCQVCGQEFRSFNLFRSHMMIHSLPYGFTSESLSCPTGDEVDRFSMGQESEIELDSLSDSDDVSWLKQEVAKFTTRQNPMVKFDSLPGANDVSGLKQLSGFNTRHEPEVEFDLLPDDMSVLNEDGDHCKSRKVKRKRNMCKVTVDNVKGRKTDKWTYDEKNLIKSKLRSSKKKYL